MNDNIIKAQIFHKMKFEGHLRWNKVIFIFENKLFFDIFLL